MRPLAVLAALVIAAVASAELPPDCRFGAGALPEETLPAGIPHGDQIPLAQAPVFRSDEAGA